jgi:hypothetical protein
MQLGRARAVLALTPNSELNQLVVREAQDEYGAGGGFVAVSKGVGDAAGRLTERLAARVLFDAPKDVARWNVRLRHGQTRLETFVRNADGEPETGAPDAGHDPYLILAVRRGKAWEPMSRDAATTDGDRVMVAIYLAERGEALQELAARGVEPAGEIADDASADDGG